MVARLGLGLSLVIGAVLAAAPLQLASKTETAQIRVSVTVTSSCLITSTATLRPYVKVTCPLSTSPFRVYSAAGTVNVDF